jgi:ABC-2 type transport system permease protein
MKKILLIIQREYLTRVKKKSFILMTLIGPLLMGGLITGAVWLSLTAEDHHNLLVVDELKIFTNIKNTSTVSFYPTDLSIDSAKKVFHTSGYTGILYIPENLLSSNKVLLFFKTQPGFASLKAIESRLEERVEKIKLDYNKIDPEKYYTIKTNININTISFKEPGKEESKGQEVGFIGFIFAILIYMFIFMYGVQVLRGVIEEKSNRIIEVIISSVKPFQLMMGKIIGIALVGLTQFILWVVLTLSITAAAQTFILKDKYSSEEVLKEVNMSTQLMQQTQNTKNIRNVDSNEILDILKQINYTLILLVFLFYFMGGYLLYGAMFAAIGAAVDNEADTQQFMLPITIPLVFAFIVAQMAMQNPEGPMAFWFSIVPFTAPVVMMVRVAYAVPVWELALSMLLLTITFILTTWLAARIYRVGILMYGKKPTYKEMWKWIFYKG